MRVFRRGHAPRTSMGDILGGGGGGYLEPIMPFEAAAHEEPRPGFAANGDPKDTRGFLESNYVAGPPRPWAAPGEKINVQKANEEEKLRASLMAPKWNPQEVLPAYPLDALRVEQDAANARLAARLAAFERRVETKEAHDMQESETLQRLAFDVRQVQEQQRTHNKISEERLIALESSMERSRRQDESVREHLSVLQKDFREFSVNTMSRQRAEMEQEVTKAFARQNAATEEWRGSLKQRDAQLQAEIHRISNSISETSAELVRSQAELRTRLSAVEATRIAGNAPAILSAGGLGQGLGMADAAGPSVDHLRQQLDALRRGSEQLGAQLAELWARCEGETASHNAMKQEVETRFASLSKAIASERDNLALRVSQRLEVLESRLGVERSEQAAKQAELHDQLTNGDNQVVSQLHDLSSTVRVELEAAERRLQSEISTLKVQVEQDFAQMSASRALEEDARRSSLASALQRLDGSSDRHAEASSSLSREVDAYVKELRDALRSETAARTEVERKLVAENGRSAQQLAGELSSLQTFVHKQAETVASELDRMRAAGADRSDRLSRYVDEKVALIIGDGTNSRLEAEIAALDERTSSLKAAVEEQANLADKRIESSNEDLRARMRKVEEGWSIRDAGTRRESDRSTTSSERRMAAAQDDLKARFEAYVKHFDSSIASVQAAILKPVAEPHGIPEPSPRPLEGLPSSAAASSPARRAPGIGWTSSAAPSLLQAAPFQASSAKDSWRPSAEWQSQELRCIVDLRVHEEPDLASQVRGRVSRGDTVTVKDIVERDRRRWASLGGQGGFLLAFSEHGFPLLEAPPSNAPPKPPQDFFKLHEDVPASSSTARPAYAEQAATQHLSQDEAQRNSAGTVIRSADRDGSLGEAVQDGVAAPARSRDPSAPTQEQDALRDNARTILKSAARDGSLVKALQDEIDRKQRAHQSMLLSSESGALAQAVDSEMAQHDGQLAIGGSLPAAPLDVTSTGGHDIDVGLSVHQRIGEQVASKICQLQNEAAEDRVVSPSMNREELGSGHVSQASIPSQEAISSPEQVLTPGALPRLPEQSTGPTHGDPA